MLGESQANLVCYLSGKQYSNKDFAQHIDVYKLLLPTVTYKSEITSMQPKLD